MAKMDSAPFLKSKTKLVWYLVITLESLPMSMTNKRFDFLQKCNFELETPANHCLPNNIRYGQDIEALDGFQTVDEG